MSGRWSLSSVQKCSDPTSKDSAGLSALDYVCLLANPTAMRYVLSLCDAHFSVSSGNGPDQDRPRLLELLSEDSHPTVRFNSGHSSPDLSVCALSPSVSSICAAKCEFFNSARHRSWTPVTLSACVGAPAPFHQLICATSGCMTAVDVTKRGGRGFTPLTCAARAGKRYDIKAAGEANARDTAAGAAESAVGAESVRRIASQLGRGLLNGGKLPESHVLCSQSSEAGVGRDVIFVFTHSSPSEPVTILQCASLSRSSSVVTMSSDSGDDDDEEEEEGRYDSGKGSRVCNLLPKLDPLLRALIATSPAAEPGFFASGISEDALSAAVRCLSELASPGTSFYECRVSDSEWSAFVRAHFYSAERRVQGAAAARSGRCAELPNTLSSASRSLNDGMGMEYCMDTSRFRGSPALQTLMFETPGLMPPALIAPVMSSMVASLSLQTGLGGEPLCETAPKVHLSATDDEYSDTNDSLVPTSLSFSQATLGPRAGRPISPVSPAVVLGSPATTAIESPSTTAFSSPGAMSPAAGAFHARIARASACDSDLLVAPRMSDTESSNSYVSVGSSVSMASLSSSSSSSSSYSALHPDNIGQLHQPMKLRAGALAHLQWWHMQGCAPRLNLISVWASLCAVAHGRFSGLKAQTTQGGVVHAQRARVVLLDAFFTPHLRRNENYLHLPKQIGSPPRKNARKFSLKRSIVDVESAPEEWQWSWTPLELLSELGVPVSSATDFCRAFPRLSTCTKDEHCGCFLAGASGGELCKQCLASSATALAAVEGRSVKKTALPRHSAPQGGTVHDNLGAQGEGQSTAESARRRTQAGGVVAPQAAAGVQSRLTTQEVGAPRARTVTATAPSSLPALTPWSCVEQLLSHGAPLVLPERYRPSSLQGRVALQRGLIAGSRDGLVKLLHALLGEAVGQEQGLEAHDDDDNDEFHELEAPPNCVSNCGSDEGCCKAQGCGCRNIENVFIRPLPSECSGSTLISSSSSSSSSSSGKKCSSLQISPPPLWGTPAPLLSAPPSAEPHHGDSHATPQANHGLQSLPFPALALIAAYAATPSLGRVNVRTGKSLPFHFAALASSAEVLALAHTQGGAEEGARARAAAAMAEAAAASKAREEDAEEQRRALDDMDIGCKCTFCYEP